jgi:hypothetical protein
VEAGRGEGERAWRALTARLPALLEELLASPVYGRGGDKVPPPRQHGVYLFSENGQHLYVGRCGVTERALKKGRGHSNFRTRLAGHTRSSSGHNQATFAWRLALEAAEFRLPGLSGSRSDIAGDPQFAVLFSDAKRRVSAMDFRVVAISEDFDSYVFEPYAALMLGTRYNSWATS